MRRPSEAAPFYLNRSIALPLEGLERLTIDGTEHGAFNTSGGIATMCETQEDIAVEDFFSTHWGHRVYDPTCEKNPPYPPDGNQ